jgi:hypothetical protein
MSDDRSFERTARAWLELGPTGAPHRAVEAALLAIESTPQVRDLRIPWRNFRMTSRARFAAAALIGVLLFGGGFLLLMGPQSQVGAPSPTPKATPGAQPIPLPAEFQAKWTSVGLRTGTGAANAASVDFIIDASDIRINGFKGEIPSSAQIGADGLLALEMQASQPSLTSQYWVCHPGDRGTYAVAFSTDHRTLTLSLVDDACTTRAIILAGDWTRWPCPNPDSSCQTELAPGRHDDPLTPRLAGLATYSYTVPAGWSHLGNDANALGRRNDPASMAITLSQDVAPHSQTGCPDAVEPGVGSSATAMADWLAHLPGLVSTTPTPITIGGYRGLMLDVSVASSWSLTCEYTDPAGERVVFTFTDLMPGPDVVVRHALYGDARSRCILLDLGAGHNLLVEITAPDKASFDDLVQAAMPIVQSFGFTP